MEIVSVMKAKDAMERVGLSVLVVVLQVADLMRNAAVTVSVTVAVLHSVVGWDHTMQMGLALNAPQQRAQRASTDKHALRGWQQ